MGTRGVSPVLALAVLVGLTVVVSVGILVIASTAVEDVQRSADQRQAEASMTAFASEAAELRDGAGQHADVSLAAGEDDAAFVNGSAGHVEVAIVENGTRESVLDGDLGAVRRRAGDDAELAYQGGGVFRRQDGHVEVVEAPAFDYRASPTPTLGFPTVRVQSAGGDAGGVDGEMTVANRSEPTAGIDNPVTGDYAVLEVRSRYCTGWQEHVRERTDGAVEEGCGTDGPDTDVGELRANMSVPDQYANRSYEEGTNGTPPRTETVVENGTYGVFAEEDVAFEGAGGTLNASIGAGGEISFANDTGYDQRGTNVENASHEREAHDDEIANRIAAAGPGEWTDFCAGPYDFDCSYSGRPGGRTIYVDELNGGAGEVTFDVSSGNVTLVVRDDFELAETTQWTVVGHESGGALRVFAEGNVTFGGATELGTAPGPGPRGMDDPIDSPPSDPAPDALQFYAGSDARLSITETFVFEGTISAPSPDPENASRAVAVESSSVTFVGALHAESIEIAAASTDLHQAPGYGTREYVRNVTPGEPSTDGRWNRTLTEPGSELYYLHVSETVLDVEA